MVGKNDTCHETGGAWVSVLVPNLATAAWISRWVRVLLVAPSPPCAAVQPVCPGLLLLLRGCYFLGFAVAALHAAGPCAWLFPPSGAGRQGCMLLDYVLVHRAESTLQAHSPVTCSPATFFFCRGCAGCRRTVLGNPLGFVLDKCLESTFQSHSPSFKQHCLLATPGARKRRMRLSHCLAAMMWRGSHCCAQMSLQTGNSKSVAGAVD